MLSSLQALLDIGKCRELPVVGFVCGFMVVGVIVSPRLTGSARI
jgi:exonuclease V